MYTRTVGVLCGQSVGNSSSPHNHADFHLSGISGHTNHSDEDGAVCGLTEQRNRYRQHHHQDMIISYTWKNSFGAGVSGIATLLMTLASRTLESHHRFHRDNVQ